MANQVSNFQFQNNALRVIVVNGEPWFLAADVCRIIGITSPTKAVKILDDDEVALKTFQDLTNGNDEANFISESGMYKIVMRSQDAIKQGTPAHAFTKWVTSEVLPAIRKTGSYSVSISKAQQGELATLIAERFPSGKDRPYAWSRFNNHFRLASYKDLSASRFDEACEYIKTMPEPVPALSANYNYPLESARPKRTIGRTAWMTVDVLLDECNPVPEMDLLVALKKAGYDVEGVRLRIESMHYQLEEYRKFRRRLKDLCEDVSVNRGRNVNFLPSGNVTARIAND